MSKTIDISKLDTKTALLIVLLMVTASVTGTTLNVNVELQSRVSNLEDQLQQTVNSTFYTLQKPCAFFVSTVTSGGSTYACMQNGTDGKLLYYSTTHKNAINYAIGNLTASRTTKERVYLKGTFTITATITLDDYLILDMDARLNKGANAISIITGTSKREIDIIGGILDGKSPTYTGDPTDNGIKLDGCVNCTVTGTTLRNCTINGILLDTCENILIDKCFFYWNGYPNAANCKWDIHCQDGCSRITIQSCFIDCGATTGLNTIGVMAWHDEEYISVLDCTIMGGNVSADALLENGGGISVSGLGAIIIGNRIYNRTYCAGINIGEAIGAVVSGNYVEHCGAAGYSGAIHLVDTNRSTVTSNTIYDCERAITIGVVDDSGVEDPAGEFDVKDCIISNNRVINGTSFGTTYGIRGGFGQRLTVSNNQFLNLTYGIQIYNNSTRQGNTTLQRSFSLISNNYFYYCDVGIYEHDTCYLYFVNNVWQNCTTNTSHMSGNATHLYHDNIVDGAWAGEV